jgi:hypothetical protein
MVTRYVQQVQQEVNMADETKFTEAEAHRKFAVAAFNATWGLLDKTDRTPEDDAAMILTTFASRYHWGAIGTPLEFERGDWQISRVFAVLNKPEPARHYAQSCLDICLKNGFKDFDLAFAYEAMARAHAVVGDKAETDKFLKLAYEAAEKIETKEDRDVFLAELKTVPGVPQ